MKKTHSVLVLLFIFNSICFSQTSENKLVFFKDSLATFTAHYVEINVSSHNSESRNYTFHLILENDGSYSCHIKDLSSSRKDIIPDKKFIGSKFRFNISENNQIQLLAENAKSSDFSIDGTISYTLHFKGFLEVLVPFINSGIIEYSKDIEMKNFSNVVPGTEKQNFSIDRGLLLIDKEIYVDTIDAKNKLNTEFMNKLKAINPNAKDMNNIAEKTLTLKHTKIRLIGRKVNQHFLVESIDSHHRYNLGNDYDRHIFYGIQRIN
jgi:hypothetical protein